MTAFRGLIQARWDGGKWAAVLLDGQTGAPPNIVDTGDVGIGAMLAHVSCLQPAHATQCRRHSVT